MTNQSPPTIELAGKTAIVTGAAVGLGNAYARALAHQGVKLALCDLRPEIYDLADVLPTECHAWQGDVSDPDLMIVCLLQ